MTFVLDAPLPAEITGRSQGWFTQYRRYPVYSTPWLRGRWRIVGITLGVLVLAMLPLLLDRDPMARPWAGFAALMVSLAGPALLGPWAARRVRRMALAPQAEWRALLAVITGVTLLATAFYAFGEEPLKQAVAQVTGQIGPDGERKKVRMMLGISVSSPDEARRPDPPLNLREAPALFAVNAATRAFLAFVLAGGWGLWAWQRERRGLAALERERALAQAQTARREAELRLSVLAAQVEPHFLFNTLAGVRSAIATDPARASEMIDRLVEYLRAAIPRLRSDGSAQATVGAQFDLVRAYLGLMKARMPRLQFTLDAEPELLKARCPPLMLISLAENAVKHGVEPKIGPVQVRVAALRTADGRLALTVEDDGVGFGASQSGTGIGLTNIRERLAQLYGDTATLALKARPEGGVAATITLPLETTA